jgi:4-hydroxy-3-methylbut-2-enyl diphosphate reductase
MKTAESGARPRQETIKRLNQFGEGFRYRHEDYQSLPIRRARENGGAWQKGVLTFYFPEHFGFCYGVDKAIDLVFETCERFKGRRIFLTDQLIHNPYINARLKEKGVQYLKRDRDNLLRCGGLRAADVVVVSAFGTDYRDLARLKNKGVTVVDSTCGAIIHVWKRVEEYARAGFITVVHGRRRHEETRATVSQALKAGGAYLIIENLREARALADVILGKKKPGDFVHRYPGCAPSPDFAFDGSVCKMGMANQTTMLREESLEIEAILRKAFVKRFGASEAARRFKSFGTICGATQDRQNALRKLLERKPDFMLIVGGFNSSNTRHLAEIAEGHLPIYHIESARDIRSAGVIRCRDPRRGTIRMKKGWFPKNAKRLGVASGASTPDLMLEAVVERICQIKQ